MNDEEMKKNIENDCSACEQYQRHQVAEFCPKHAVRNEHVIEKEEDADDYMQLEQEEHDRLMGERELWDAEKQEALL